MEAKLNAEGHGPLREPVAAGSQAQPGMGAGVRGNPLVETATTSFYFD